MPIPPHLQTTIYYHFNGSLSIKKDLYMKRKTLTKHKYCLYLFIAIAFVASILHGPGAEPKTADAAITVSTPTPTMKLIGITAYYT